MISLMSVVGVAEEKKFFFPLLKSFDETRKSKREKDREREKERKIGQRKEKVMSR